MKACRSCDARDGKRSDGGLRYFFSNGGGNGHLSEEEKTNANRYSSHDALCAVLRTMRFLCTGDGCGGRKRREANGSAESGRIVLAGEA